MLKACLSFRFIPGLFSGHRRFDIRTGPAIELPSDALRSLGVDLLDFLFVSRRLSFAQLAGEFFTGLIQRDCSSCGSAGDRQQGKGRQAQGETHTSTTTEGMLIAPTQLGNSLLNPG